MENNKPPYFHQIVIADYLANRVKIPPLFMKHLSKDLCEEETTNATIKSDVGIWPVKLRKTSTYTYIEEGWPKIMEDNSLGDMEFLVFRYDGNMCFNLQIFEKTGCERIYPSTIISGIPKEECVYEEINVAQGDYTFNFENPHFRKCLTESNVIKSFTLRLPKEFSTKISSSESVIIEIENTKGEAWEVKATMNTGTYCLSSGWRNFVFANKLEVGGELIFELIDKKRIRVHKIIA
ncbi:B3 domain-containing protein REM9-like [Silene latifolia]|uniref:B3 domain-containing protein REM9-like n=1 Tax=Silene latifolia TaxID=37657 RepID=UPI003D781827